MAADPLLGGCRGLGTSDEPTAGKPRRGGNLRVGIVGGGVDDTLDAHKPVSHPDQARVFALYDTLLERDPEFRLRPGLAESLTSSQDARTWTLKLRGGVTFHNGKALTVDDVIFTFQRILDPKEPKSQAASLAMIDMNALRKIDDLTLQIGLKQPSVLLGDHLSNYAAGIVPAGYDPTEPVGTGPFKYLRFTPGKRSEFVRNPDYWRADQPYAEQLTIVDYPDDTDRVSALIAGEVDAIDQMPFGWMSIVRTESAMRLLESETGGWLPFTMRVDKAPFSDPRVRQALRLIIDRQDMVELALAGHGKVGNDLFAPFDPLTARDFPQRGQDLAQARSLLRRAGHRDLRVELVTAPVAAGVVAAAEAFERQAQQAGVTVRLNKVSTEKFFGSSYLSWDFAQDFWFTRNYLPQVAQSMVPTAPFNETHWTDPDYLELIAAANVAVDEAKRRRLIQDAQKIEYDSGGYIIWGFANQVDAYSEKVGGLRPDKSGIPLASYRFGQMWLS